MWDSVSESCQLRKQRRDVMSSTKICTGQRECTREVTRGSKFIWPPISLRSASLIVCEGFDLVLIFVC